MQKKQVKKVRHAAVFPIQQSMKIANQNSYIEVFREYAHRLRAALKGTKGMTKEINRLFVWLQNLTKLESVLGEISVLIIQLDDQLARLINSGSGGRFGFGVDGKLDGLGNFGGLDSTLTGFLDQMDRLQGLIDIFDSGEENLKAGRPDGDFGSHGTSMHRMADGTGLIVTMRETDKDGHEVAIRGMFFDDGRMRITTTTRDYDGHGGLSVDTYDGANSSRREYDSSGRVVGKFDTSMTQTIKAGREEIEPLINERRPRNDDEHMDPTPAPGEEGVGGNMGQEYARVIKLLGRMRDSMTSILGIVRAGLREGGAHPVREGDIDPNTGLGPLDERGFVPSFVIGSALDLDHAVDPNTGLDPHLNIDPNRINMLVGSNDDPDRPTDPNTGLDRPPVHSSPRDRSEFTFVMTSSVMAGSPAKAGDSADDVGEDSEKGLTAITPGDLKNG